MTSPVPGADAGPSPPARSPTRLVETHDLTRVYRAAGGEVRALDGVDLRVHRGEFLAVVGVSGSGKSTLLHLLGGLDRPTRGWIDVDGRRLAAMSEAGMTLYRRTIVGFVFQFFYLVKTLSAEANLRLALTFQGVYGVERRRRAREALEMVALGDRAGHRPDQLSGGEQQRVAIARALAHRPSLLLADEPTGNLDQRTAADVVGLMRESCRRLGTAVVMVTHDLRLARDHCDRLVRLEDGRLAANEGAVG